MRKLLGGYLLGKYEVLGLLTLLRDSGDNKFYRYNDIHQMMLERGISNNYTSVWRSINSLFCDGLLDVEKEGDILSRTLRFRCKKELSNVNVKKNKEYYTYQAVQDNRLRKFTREDSKQTGPVPNSKEVKHG